MEKYMLVSSYIYGAGYDHDMFLLEIAFHSGEVWQYPGVPPETWYEFLAAPSHGEYFSKNILPYYGDGAYRTE